MAACTAGYAGIHPGVRSTKQSGADLAHLISYPQLKNATYWDGLREIRSSDESYDVERAKKLWEWSTERWGIAKDI
ncbi:hypothetical protein [Aureibacillus halotolerans]|uniref:hypothetical protein n=1 Tax=Aureibacillus halotolerans TaxID=1508390 RepID=UPI001060BFD2|nr:hypothetical protein [Aureibacillus halotolerans]